MKFLFMPALVLLSGFAAVAATNQADRVVFIEQPESVTTGAPIVRGPIVALIAKDTL